MSGPSLATDRIVISENFGLLARNYHEVRLVASSPPDEIAVVVVIIIRTKGETRSLVECICTRLMLDRVHSGHFIRIVSVVARGTTEGR